MAFRKNSFGTVVQVSHFPDQDIQYDRDLFENKLCNIHFPLQTLQKYAEQEYILQNMVKGAIQESFIIAKKNNTSIVTRPTSLVAFMNNEAGHPTKPQEIKNKTSKIEDHILHPKITRHDIGAVVHYKPFPQNVRTLNEFRRYSELLWNTVYQTVKHKILTNHQTNLVKVKHQFESRSQEYFEENPHYKKGGKFSHTVIIDEPFLYLRSAPGIKIYGDHDLFCFADSSGKIPLPMQNDFILLELRYSKRFQAQHGPIYYWKPSSSFERGIKSTIMSCHDVVQGKDPLIVTTPQCVQLCFYNSQKNSLESVWEHLRTNTTWLSSTYSGKKFLETSYSTPKLLLRGG
ncbi:hypothetical protein [Silvanigrella aquatica]|uniref:Uncharacterized protein n=1 Tax=Silvanigrella aquatica TaxID=1915309 RepID=A0A1L4CXJ6_9BACT|nr:hypothetical protein [Silvanigrella aquatica]APJ02670.1 hypothetical protein AXG55_01475 [Silvanigrella aquatica]